MAGERDLFGFEDTQEQVASAALNKKHAVSPDHYQRVIVQPLASFANGLDYLVPCNGRDSGITKGQCVRIMISGQRRLGVIWHVYQSDDASDLPFDKCRPIEDLLPYIVPEIYLIFLEKVAHYTFSSCGSVVRMCLSVPEALEPMKLERFVTLKEVYRHHCALDSLKQLSVRKSSQRVTVISYLQSQTDPVDVKHLQQTLQIRSSVITPLIAAGLLVEMWRPPDIETDGKTHPRPSMIAPPTLSETQQVAANRLSAYVLQGQAQTIVLDGVTGSGKTEVYFEAINTALSQQKQVLVLLPEIALSAQWCARFRQRFGFIPDVWHSNMTLAQRRDTWRRIQSGKSCVLVGARSALFLPMKKLGLIIVDEEHESSYKQEEGVRYHARDMAVLLGHLTGIAVILVSATPSLETLCNVKAGRYQHVILPQRHGEAQLPKGHIIDLRREKLSRHQWVATPLKEAISVALAAGQQALLFLNRRGYAPLTLCRDCGYRLECPNCSAWLVSHQHLNGLLCHHCGYRACLNPVCSGCGQVDSMVACGPGVERLQEEISQYFPKARLALLTSDRFQTSQDIAHVIAEIEARRVDILIGTQMIAKGYHFPHLTIVGIVDADLGLMGGDLRAAEKSYQLLQQVSGRAGRSEALGQVFLQTRQPDHPVFQAILSQDRDQFIQHESDARYLADMPPYGRLIAVIISGPQPEDVENWAGFMARQAPIRQDITLLGPVEAPLARLRGRYRMRFLIKGQTYQKVHGFMQVWIQLSDIYKRTLSKDIRLHIDVDPYSFM